MEDRKAFIKRLALTLGGMVLASDALRAAPSNGGTGNKISALKAGDLVAIASPAGAVWDMERVTQFTDILKGFGFRVIHGETLRAKHGYFAGEDAFRAGEMNALYKNEEVKGIFCMKGGWGSARILRQLDYGLIAEHPKVLIGFSDITALLLSIYARTGQVTFHGPVGNSGWNSLCTEVFRNVVMEKKTLRFPEKPFGEPAPVTIREGKARGILAGGNLSVICSLMGTDHLPDWNGKLLFLEEAHEEPYRIDRMLTQLKLGGVLDKVNGVVFGQCTKCDAEEPEKAFTYTQVLEQHFGKLKVPCFYGAMIGHTENKLTLPIGVNAEMDANTGSLCLLEAAVD